MFSGDANEMVHIHLTLGQPVLPNVSPRIPFNLHRVCMRHYPDHHNTRARPGNSQRQIRGRNAPNSHENSLQNLRPLRPHDDCSALIYAAVRDTQLSRISDR